MQSSEQGQTSKAPPVGTQHDPPETEDGGGVKSVSVLGKLSLDAPTIVILLK